MNGDDLARITLARADRLTTDPVTGAPYYRKDHPMTDHLPPAFDDDDPTTPADLDRAADNAAADAHYGDDPALVPSDFSPLEFPTDYVTTDPMTPRDERVAKACALCGCPANLRLFGFRVCEYHHSHGEDDPACPTCYPKDGLPMPTTPPIARMVQGVVDHVRAQRPDVVPSPADPLADCPHPADNRMLVTGGRFPRYACGACWKDFGPAPYPDPAMLSDVDRLTGLALVAWIEAHPGEASDQDATLAKLVRHLEWQVRLLNQRVKSAMRLEAQEHVNLVARTQALEVARDDVLECLARIEELEGVTDATAGLRARHTVQRSAGIGSVDRHRMAGEDPDDYALRGE